MKGISIHAIGLACAAAVLLAAAAVVPIDSPPFSLFACPLRAATGLPCLSCGFSHAFHFAVRGQLLQAFSASPLGALLALACAAHLLWTLLRLAGLAGAPALPQVPARALRLAALGALAANWAWLALRGAA